MTRFPVVSIIVPVYKAELYLEECVRSLTNQTFADIEILLVNDGSPDRSGQLADRLARDDDRIHVFHKENEGVSRARAYGLSKARGQWIVFVDVDDSLTDDAVEFLHYWATENNYDVVLGTWRRITLNGNRKGWIGKYGCISGDEYVRALLSGKVPAGIWGKIFRKEILENNTMDIPSDITNNEDLILNIRVALRASRIGVFPSKIVYNYYLRENSASLRHLSWQQWDRIFDVLKATLPPKYEREFLCYVIGMMRFKKNETDFRQSAYFALCDSKRNMFPFFGRYNADLRYMKSGNLLNRFASDFWIMFRRGEKFVIRCLSRLYE